MIETDRLILRPFETRDRPPYAALNADPAVMEFFPKTLTAEEANAQIDVFEARRREDGVCFAAAALKSGELIGMCGLARPRFEAPFLPAVEIGWRFARSVWGQGFAAEAAQAWLDHGFDDLGLSEIIAFAPRINERSLGLMRRLGMTTDPGEDFDHPGFAPDHRLNPMRLYRLTQAASRAS